MNYFDTHISIIRYRKSGGEKIIIRKTGEVCLLDNGEIREFSLQLSEEDGIPRCCYKGKNGIFYIGTSGKRILKLSDNGSILSRTEADGMASFNRIYEVNGGEYWVCSDTGIGILKNDRLTKIQLPLDDSVESGCRDFQGNYWFVSSRQGILQIYKNHFSDLRSHWNLKETVNSIQVYHGKTYVGCDNGLYCFRGKKRVTDNLTNACRGMRIRQIYLDEDDDLWISTYQNGIKVFRAGGKISDYNTVNSGIGTNQIRCIWKCQNKEVLIGTEDGLYVIDSKGVIRNFTEDDILKTRRILDVEEDNTGTVYAATDGYGVFEIKNGVVTNTYSKQQGLLSNVVMKVVASNRMTIENGILYMCGTTGAVAIDLNEEESEKPIRLYIDNITEDGKEIKSDDNEAVISPYAHRISIDVRMINFVHRNLYAGYCLDGTDEKETLIKNVDTAIGYTNLAGGSYKYNYTVYDGGTGKALLGLSVPLVKKYKFREEPRVKVLMVFLGIGVLILLFILLMSLREKGVKRKYYLEFLQEKEAEISELAYRDLVTGVYNRNYFEHEKDKIDLKKMSAILSVSINHAEYFKGKYGVFFMESVLRKGVKILQDCTSENIRICRVSENIFYFWFMEPVQMENYISDIKAAFKELGDKEKIQYSFSVGAIYNNTVGKENIDELIDRCDKMRLLDEKHSEAQFITSKMKML